MSKIFITLWSILNGLMLMAPQTAQATGFYQKNQATLQQVEQYLNNITTLRATFSQTINDNTSDRTAKQVEGEFLLARPGRIRISYLRPNKFSIIVNKKRMAYYDQELDEITYFKTEQSLLGLLAQKHISFSNDTIKIVDYIEDDYGIDISLISTVDKESNGQLTLLLRKKPKLALTGLTITGITNEEIQVDLQKLVYNEKIADKNFNIPDKRLDQNDF